MEVTEELMINIIENEPVLIIPSLFHPNPVAFKDEEPDQMEEGKCEEKDHSDREIPYAAPPKDLNDL